MTSTCRRAALSRSNSGAARSRCSAAQTARLRALENRCAHRHVKLSIGQVTGCTLTCAYHGWTYDADGRLVEVPHELFGRQFGKVKIRSYPIRSRYGLIWLFPGDPALADRTPMPEISELEGPDRWACCPIDFTWRAHHSIIVDNVSDFTHAYLHRRYRPFVDAKLSRCETVGNKVELSYDVVVGDGRISKLFVDRKRVRTDRMELGFRLSVPVVQHWRPDQALVFPPADRRADDARFLPVLFRCAQRFRSRRFGFRAR